MAVVSFVLVVSEYKDISYPYTVGLERTTKIFSSVIDSPVVLPASIVTLGL